MDLPTGYAGPVHFYWHIQHNFFHISDREMTSPDYIYLGEKHVSVTFDADAVHDQALTMLDDHKQKELDRHAGVMRAIEETRQSLLALEYKQ